MGIAHCTIGEYSEALFNLDRAIDLEPDFAWAYSNRAWACAELGQYQKALTDATKAIELDPELADAYANRGIIYKELGMKTQAIADLEKYISLVDDPVAIEQAKQFLQELSD